MSRSTYPLSGSLLRRTGSEGSATQPDPRIVLPIDHGTSLGRPWMRKWVKCRRPVCPRGPCTWVRFHPALGHTEADTQWHGRTSGPYIATDRSRTYLRAARLLW